ncbi:hypothetical protein [Sphingomonas oryzagri]
MFGWFRKRGKLQPEARWIVTVDPDRIHITDQTGASKALLKDELAGVIIETNDSGPWGADVWWLLFGADDKLACAFPQGATGEQQAIGYLMALPGFDHGKMVESMGSTDNAVFPVWRRQA